MKTEFGHIYCVCGRAFCTLSFQRISFKDSNQNAKISQNPYTLILELKLKFDNYDVYRDSPIFMVNVESENNAEIKNCINRGSYK